MRALQWRSPDELAARAAERLHALLVHAYRHVGHYRKLFDAAGVDPAAIRGVEDLPRVPITTKTALRASPLADVVADDRPADDRFTTITSGSTGCPFEIRGDPASADEALASYLFFLEWAGAAVWQTRVDVGVRLGRSHHAAPWMVSTVGRPDFWCPSSALRIAARWATDVPQQPPTILAPESTARRTYSDISSGDPE